MTQPPPPRREPPVSFRPGDAGPALRQRVDLDAPVSALVPRELQRYYTVLADSLATLPLSLAEASLVVDALRGTIHEPHTYRLLWAGIDDAIAFDGLGGKWGLSARASATLVAKLRALSPGGAMAVGDAAERFWVRVARHAPPPYAFLPDDAPDRATMLREVGLLW